MIIGIDISSVVYGTGVSNYTSNLVRHLIKLDKKNSYKLLFYSLRQSLPPEIKVLLNQPNVKLYHYRLPPTFFEIIWNRLHIFPLEFFIGKCDVFHTWDWNEPPSLWAKKVTTFHDFVPILYPENQHPRTIKNFNQKLSYALKEDTLFICVSDNTATDLTKLFPQIDIKKIVIIAEAADDKYKLFQKLKPSDQKNKIELLKKQYGLKQYILTQGTREPRKNLSRLIEAFIKFKKTHIKSKLELAISGGYGWGQDISAPHPDIKILGYVPEKDIVTLHAGALCLAYPSLYEGFGLPIVKSFTVGVPVLTSNISSIPEVAGKAALLVDPYSVGSIYTALKKIILSRSTRSTLINRGLIQARKFSWDKTAQLTLNAYQKLINN
ncbi:glycosyltransferase family 4 protein [Candidatus Shapirobacteria bacterium]|nr:glycosyltransferase family 4 protein [Candidatus Shapirobacteria bacterium]